MNAAESERRINDDKRKIVSDLSDKMSKAQGVILTECSGLTVADLTELRIKLRRIQGELKILQNRLTKIAIASIPGTEPLKRYLTGPTAAVFSYGDPVAMAKTIKEFAADREKFKVKAGFVSGRFLEPPDVLRLANLPSRQTLICNLVGLLSSPMRRLVTALSQPQRSLVQVLAQVAKKKGA